MRNFALAASLMLALSPLAFTTALAAQDAPAAEAPVAAAATKAPDPVWAFETSDVPVDPGYTFGQLPNGMRYVIRQNATPAGTALVRMRIDSGALEETDSERGLSHYLEHMAFNGSKGIPEGEMIKLLEREGLAFGADTNASTGFDAITYMLNLPRNDEALLGTALMLMRETASELTISEDAVARERGVILAERRDRAGFQLRNYEDNAAFIAPGARYTERLPIGTAEVLENATAAQIRALYERTYRPANTVLVVVGDFPVPVVEAAIRERFASWAPAPAPAEPEAGPIDTSAKGLTDIHIDPALPETVTISRLSPWRDDPDTIATRRADALRSLGYAIINRRLARLARGADAPFRVASFGTGDIFEDARITSLSVSTADGEWNKGVLAAVREVNQAMTFGFTQAEVDEQLANLRTALENAAKSADTRGNNVFVGAALALAGDERVPVTPEWQLAEFERLAPEMTPQALWEAVREDAAPLEEPLIRFTGRTAPEGGEVALRSAFGEGMALAITAPVDNGPLAFAYTDFGTPGTVVSDTVEERLGIRRIVFDNGVRLNLKRTDVRKDRIAVSFALDGGDLMNTRDAPLRAYLASTLPSGGLGKHSQDEIASVLAGRSVSFDLNSSADAFTASAVTTPRDLLLQLQVLAATLTDPGYRPEGVERFRKNIDNFFNTLDSTPGRALSSASGAILSDDDPRFSLQPREAFFALDYEALRNAIGDRLAEGAIEIALAGDLDEDAAIAAVAATLGALPQREAAFNPRTENRDRSFTATRGKRVLTHKGEADQALLQWYWPTTDDSDLGETLRLDLLSRIVRLELTDRLREELGQAYSPSAGSQPSHYYPGYGVFIISASVAVDQIEPSRAALQGLIADLRKGPLDADVIERARKPYLEDYSNVLKDLSGWIGLASRAQSEPARLDRFVATPDVLRAITPEDIHQTALKYLDPDGAVAFTVVPEAAAGTAAE
ncbi:M16 family metallopeptidase [Porphyrobacter sp. YT40]|uniref:M16 family metallopeptidase n=1 Tax=Porphyrobacter sp. YT40 TaxID=2547601 RepID=UPI0011448AD9|nr:M16 family metallopeptidase [Porphyrobacter sp. YT40]QDH35463.1 insulinase family protein [Porphyrobacter sp. YT40]